MAYADQSPGPQLPSPLRILLVEDSAADRVLIERAIAGAPPDTRLTTECAECLAAAVGRLHDARFDVVLLDLGLPDASGLEALDVLVGLSSPPPVVVVTGYEDDDTALEAIRRGAQEYLIKGHPSSDSLLRVIRWAVERATLQQEARARLREAERARADLLALTQASPDAILVVDDEGIIRFANRAASGFFERAPEALVGLPFGFPAHPDGVAEVDLPHPGGGEPLVAEMRATEVDLGEGPARRVILRDVTERHRAEQALAASESRYRHLFESLTDAAFVADAQTGIILEANAQSETLLGRTRDEIVGRRHVEFHPPDALSRYERLFATHVAALAAGEHDGEVARKDGTAVPVAISASTLKVDGRPAVLELFHDLTERRRLEQQTLQSSKLEAVGTLAGGVAHDLNNILTGIGGYVGFVLEDPTLAAGSREDLGHLHDLVDRATSLTRQLLAFGRRQTLEPTVLDPNALVGHLTPMLARLLGEDIDLALHLSPDVGLTYADPGQIEQSIVNLAANARDAMPEGGRLGIGTAPVVVDEAYVATHPEAQLGPHVLITVTDTGLGMDQTTLSRIFEPFFTTKEVGQGTGLGLSSVHGIVRQHGGHITAHSEPGRGATFRIYLPQVAATADGEAEEAAVRHGRATILLVEDEPHVRVVCRRSLELHGHTVLGCGNADEARRLFADRGSEVDLLVTDVVMPGGNGKELYDSLAAQHPGLRVLYMSGYTTSAIADRVALDPGTPFLPKPFTADTLLRKVSEALRWEADS